MWVCDRNRSPVNLPVLHDRTVTSVFIEKQYECKGSEHFFHHWCSVIWGDYHVCVHACMHLFRCACLRVHLMSSCLIHRENVIARCVFPRSRSDICSRLIGSDGFILHHIQVSLKRSPDRNTPISDTQLVSWFMLFISKKFKFFFNSPVCSFPLLVLEGTPPLSLWTDRPPHSSAEIVSASVSGLDASRTKTYTHTHTHTHTHRKRGRHVSDTNRLICFPSGPCCDAESPLSRALCDNISPSLRAVYTCRGQRSAGLFVLTWDFLQEAWQAAETETHTESLQRLDVTLMLTSRHKTVAMVTDCHVTPFTVRIKAVPSKNNTQPLSCTHPASFIGTIEAFTLTTISLWRKTGSEHWSKIMSHSCRSACFAFK